jgi:hypothetical protein
MANIFHNILTISKGNTSIVWDSIPQISRVTSLIDLSSKLHKGIDLHSYVLFNELENTIGLYSLITLEHEESKNIFTNTLNIHAPSLTSYNLQLPVSCTPKYMVVSLGYTGTAGSTALSVKLLGITIFSVTIPSGQENYSIRLSPLESTMLLPGVSLTIEVTSVADDSSNLILSPYFSTISSDDLYTTKTYNTITGILYEVQQDSYINLATMLSFDLSNPIFSLQSVTLRSNGVLIDTEFTLSNNNTRINIVTTHTSIEEVILKINLLDGTTKTITKQILSYDKAFNPPVYCIENSSIILNSIIKFSGYSINTVQQQIQTTIPNAIEISNTFLPLGTNTILLTLNTQEGNYTESISVEVIPSSMDYSVIIDHPQKEIFVINNTTVPIKHIDTYYNNELSKKIYVDYVSGFTDLSISGDNLIIPSGKIFTSGVLNNYTNISLPILLNSTYPLNAPTLILYYSKSLCKLILEHIFDGYYKEEYSDNIYICKLYISTNKTYTVNGYTISLSITNTDYYENTTKISFDKTHFNIGLNLVDIADRSSSYPILLKPTPLNQFYYITQKLPDDSNVLDGQIVFSDTITLDMSYDKL